MTGVRKKKNGTADTPGKPAGASKSVPAGHQNEIQVLSSLIDNLRDAFMATDSNFKIAQWNKAAEKIYGWSIEETRGGLVSDFIQTEYINGNEEEALKKVQTEGVWRDEVIQHHRDGRKISVFSTVSLIKDEQGHMTGLVVINRNITESKRAEERFRLAEELAPQEPERKIRFEIEEQAEEQCDAGLARIVLQNLFSNARKFSSATQGALIQFGRSAENLKGRSVFFVKDNGVFR